MKRVPLSRQGVCQHCIMGWADFVGGHPCSEHEQVVLADRTSSMCQGIFIGLTQLVTNLSKDEQSVAVLTFLGLTTL